MGELLRTFADAAGRLSRNPLGILALFLVLVYGIAVAFFNASLSKFAGYERIIIVLFVVLFPVLVLVLFVRLVMNHHYKLYAPGDYADPQGFLKAMTQQEADAKLDEDAKSLVESSGVPEVTATVRPEVRRDIAAARRDVQEAEDLAIGMLERTGERVLRRQKIGDIAVDGVLTGEHGLTVVEVKLVSRKNLSNVLDGLLGLAFRLVAAAPSVAAMTVILVTRERVENQEAQRLIVRTLDHLAPTGLRLRVFVWPLDDLKEDSTA